MDVWAAVAYFKTAVDASKKYNKLLWWRQNGYFSFHQRSICLKLTQTSCIPLVNCLPYLQLFSSSQTVISNKPKINRNKEGK